MLIRENNVQLTQRVCVMTDVAIFAASIKTTLLQIAEQAKGLGVGLQNAAPARDTPNQSVQYLLAVSEIIQKTSIECDQFLTGTHHDETQKPGF